MKKVMLLLSAIILAWFIGCVKEAEQPLIQYNFSVETPDEKFTEKGVNEEVNIPIQVKSLYDFSKVPMKYKVDWDKQGKLKIGGREIQKGETYPIDTTNVQFSYVGLEEGEHRIKLNFFNDKGTNTEKEIIVNYVKYNFTTSIGGGTENVYQGENVEYNLLVTPENTTINDIYKIKFISYDEKDPTLTKSFVGLNGAKIEFNKEYVLNTSTTQKININSFYSGRKELVCKIINNSSEKTIKINQNILQSQLEITDLNFNKLITNSLRDRLQIRGFIEKKPNLNREIFYKTWIVDVPTENKDGIENTNNEYQKYTLPPNKEFTLELQVKKIGTFKYMIQFRDEFGTESSPIPFTVKVVNNDFNIEQKINTNLNNVFQGSNIDIDFEIKEDLPSTEAYQIQFLSFDPADQYLEKSKIKLNNAEIQPNKWYSIEKGIINKIILTPFYFGNKKLVYQIKNNDYTKDKELAINVNKTNISIQNLSLRYHREGIVYINEPFSISGKIEKTYPNNGKIECKTWLTNGDKNKINSVTDTYTSYVLNTDNVFHSDFSISEAGNYTLNIRFKDEFGNESEVKTFNIKAETKLEIEEAIAVYKIKVSIEEGECNSDDCSETTYVMTGEKDFSLKIKAKSGTGNLLYKTEINIDEYKNVVPKTQKNEEIGLKNEINKKIMIIEGKKIENHNTRHIDDFYTDASFMKRYLTEWANTKPIMKIKLYDNMGNNIEKEVPITVIWGDIRLN